MQLYFHLFLLFTIVLPFEETEKKLEETTVSCGNWIHHIFRCRLHDQKASRKTEKYTFRFAKTLKDAFWHLIGTNKCESNKRNRRATFLSENINSSLFGQELSRRAFEKLFDENIRAILKNSRAAKEKERYSGKLSIENLEKICSGKIDNFLSSEEFESCSKLSSWKKRKAGLMKTMRKVQKSCSSNKPSRRHTLKTSEEKNMARMMSDVPMISTDLISEEREEKIVLKATHIPKGELVNVIDLSAGLFYDDPDEVFFGDYELPAIPENFESVFVDFY